MITNQDITIFNLRLDKKNRREVFILHKLYQSDLRL